MSHSPDYDRYMKSPQWRSRSEHAIEMWRGRCSVLPFLKANHAHHMTYRNFQHEIVWRDIIPVNKVVHSILHSPLFWVDRKPHSLRRTGTAFLLRLWVVLSFAIVRAFVTKPKRSRRHAR